MEIVLDALKLLNRSDAHDYLKEALKLPEYYGKNLDALHDCLTEKRGSVTFINAESLRESYTYGARVLKVFNDSGWEVRLREG